MADIEANGLFNVSQSSFSRDVSGSAFFPDEFPAQTLSPGFQFVRWNSTSIFSSNAFIADVGDPARVICTIPGVYLARAIVSLPSFVHGEPYCFVEFSVNGFQIHHGRAAKKLVQGVVTDFPQSMVCEAYLAFEAGDYLTVSASANPNGSVLGIPQFSSSSLNLRRVCGIPGPH